MGSKKGKTRNELYDYLHSKKIGVQVHYSPVHLQPYYRSLGFTKGYCPNAEQYGREALSLPIYPGLSKNEQEKVIELIRMWSNANQRLSIGTAQLGLDYGITNKKGKPSIEEAISLLDMAWDHNIKLLDTAQGYGDAEEVLERAMGKGKRFKTTTKIKPCQERIITKEINGWEEDIEKTTKRLRHAEMRQ